LKKRTMFCFDERPCFLIGEIVQGIEMKSGQVGKKTTLTRKKAHVRCLPRLNR
jgi:hypothetical protein